MLEFSWKNCTEKDALEEGKVVEGEGLQDTLRARYCAGSSVKSCSVYHLTPETHRAIYSLARKNTEVNFRVSQPLSVCD